MGAGLPADIRRAQSGQVACSDALARQGMALDEVSAAIFRRLLQADVSGYLSPSMTAGVGPSYTVDIYRLSLQK